MNDNVNDDNEILDDEDKYLALDADYNTSLKPVLDADEYAEEVHTGKEACTKFVDNFEAILLEDEEMNDCHRMEIRMIRYYIAAVENPVIADCPHEGISVVYGLAPDGSGHWDPIAWYDNFWTNTDVVK